MLLNQGQVEQVMIDHIEGKGRVAIERNKSAKKIHFTEDPTRPVAVEAKSVRLDRMVDVLQDGDSGEHGHAEVTEVIQAQYVVACDGARSLVRDQLDVPMESRSTDSTWAVIDIVPITDFRMSLTIHYQANVRWTDRDSRHSPILRHPFRQAWQHHDCTERESPCTFLSPAGGGFRLGEEGSRADRGVSRRDRPTCAEDHGAVYSDI